MKIAAIALLLSSLLGCRINTNSGLVDIQVTNGTTSPVTYFARGVGERPDSAVTNGVPLDPGQTDTDTWSRPTNPFDPPAQVWAIAADGDRTFCRRFSYTDLQGLNWRITIVAGVSACE